MPTPDAYWSSASDRFYAEYIPPPLNLFVIGAGDDAKPLVEIAYQLGWQITVADRRTHLVTRERFPLADSLHMPARFEHLAVTREDAAVILTHSYEQDRAALRALLPIGCSYLGLLGPRHRTSRMLQQVAPQVGLTPGVCMARLHAPVGLNIGASNPAAIALAICAEIYGVMNGGHEYGRNPSAITYA